VSPRTSALRLTCFLLAQIDCISPTRCCYVSEAPRVSPCQPAVRRSDARQAGDGDGGGGGSGTAEARAGHATWWSASAVNGWILEDGSGWPLVVSSLAVAPWRFPGKKRACSLA